MSEVAKLLKLSSGEEMLCRVDDKSFSDAGQSEINFRDGRTVGINPQTQGVGLMNFSALGGDLQKGVLHKSAIIADMDIPNEIEKKYLGDVSGGIVVPTA